MIFKLAEKFASKYSIGTDHWGVNPDTGLPIQPKFENGDTVSYLGRKAVYLSKAFWEKDPNIAIIHYLDKPVLKKNSNNFNFDYVNENHLTLLKKKNENKQENLDE
jgi:hypothetical protein